MANKNNIPAPKPLTAKQVRMQERKKEREDLKTQIEAATNSRKLNLDQKREEIIHFLESLANKYKTINGFMEARATIMTVANPNKDWLADDTRLIHESKRLARETSKFCTNLVRDFKKLKDDEVKDFLNNRVSDEFVSIRRTFNYYDAATELMISVLTNNLADPIDSFAQFEYGSAEEIKRLNEALKAV